MDKPIISEHFTSRQPSPIRKSQIEFAKRTDSVKAVNTAIGNVSLPMHPKMQERAFNLREKFGDGVVKYSATIGFKETNYAFLNIIASSGFDSSKLYSQIVDGGSHAMELAILGTCSKERPLMLIDAAYANYNTMAKRLGVKTVSISRYLDENGKFAMPDLEGIEKVIQEKHPGAIVVIPYDNPTGYFYNHKTMEDLAGLCLKYNMWMISDEAYRELYYVNHETVSIWGMDTLNGRRISIETASKVWNACGLRIGALVTDNEEFHTQSVAENTTNLCSPVIAQYIFGALAHESHDALRAWYAKQRGYYRSMMHETSSELKNSLPGVIVSSPDASIYSVIDVRKLNPDFDAMDFVMWCAKEGKVDINGKEMTLLVSPMAGFYSAEGEKNPGKTQMRIAYVAPPDEMKLVPKLFSELYKQYDAKR